MFLAYRLYLYGAIALALVASFGVLGYKLHSAQADLATAKLEVVELHRTHAERQALANAATVMANQQSAALQRKASDEYQTKLAALRATYAASVRVIANTPSLDPHVPGLPESAGGPDGPACDPGLASRAAEVTLQLVELQAWIRANLKPPN